MSTILWSETLGELQGYKVLQSKLGRQIGTIKCHVYVKFVMQNSETFYVHMFLSLTIS